MSGVELVLAFLAGVAMGIALDRWLLPPLVDAWIDRLRRHTYAQKYWNNYNSAYKDFSANGGGGDCTNFISQILREGGWKFVTGLYTSGDAWWYNALNQSYTWAGAENWSWFAPKRTVALSRVYDMTVADVLQYDLTKNGTMDHTMFVQKKTTTDIYMTYHTTDHYNRPLAEILALYPAAAWYACRTWMLPGTFRVILATAALVAAVTGCSLMPAPTAAPAGQAEREVLIGQFIDAVECGDAAAIAGMTDPVVDARADIAAILEAHGSRPWNNVRVAWGADEEGGQAIWADITGTTPQGPDSIRILTIWDTQRATLALGAAPGIDPGSDPSSPRP